MRVALLGAGGMLAHALQITAPTGMRLIPLRRDELDVTDAGALERVLDAHLPAAVLNAAAFTAVDVAEAEPELAFRVNAEAVGALGAAAARRGTRVVHFSTDYVFDGSSSRPYAEDAPARPLNMYGRSKLEGERRLLASGAPALVVRTQWLFGPAGRSFPALMWERATGRVPTRVVEDQIGRPTYTLDLARAAWRLLEGGHTGVFHVANEGTASWFELATAVFARAGARDLITPCRTAEFPRPAARPPHSVLGTDKLRATLGHALPSWEDALAHFLTALQSAA